MAGNAKLSEWLSRSWWALDSTFLQRMTRRRRESVLGHTGVLSAAKAIANALLWQICLESRVSRAREGYFCPVSRFAT